MDIPATKLELMRLLLNTDSESVLRKVEEILTATEKDEVAGYAADGKPLTKEDLIKRALKSEEDIKAGRLKSIEQVVEEMKDW